MGAEGRKGFCPKPDALEKYKALGKGYTGIMADVLNYVANNPEILSKALS
ncbi:MAG: hypothetical protein LBQ61_06420 [Spirochaetales bacterium]|jgi:hypothetical protein|nr:hypothetical protein [Spirochaetales bacterium]